MMCELQSEYWKVSSEDLNAPAPNQSLLFFPSSFDSKWNGFWKSAPAWRKSDQIQPDKHTDTPSALAFSLRFREGWIERSP